MKSKKWFQNKYVPLAKRELLFGVSLFLPCFQDGQNHLPGLIGLLLGRAFVFGFFDAYFALETSDA